MAGYGSDAGFTAWLAENGLELPEGGLAEAVLRQRGSVYLDGTYGSRFPGVPTGGYAQERAWPRTGATVFNADLPSNVIPDAVISASYFAALQEATSPGSLSVTVTQDQRVKREKVGPIETEYQSGGGDAVTSATPLLTSVEGLLSPFFTKAECGVLLV